VHHEHATEDTGYLTAQAPDERSSAGRPHEQVRTEKRAHRGWAVARADGTPEEDLNRPPRPRDSPEAIAARAKRRRTRRRRHIMRRVRRVGGVVLLVVVALAAWVGVRGWMAKGHLERAAALVPQLEQQARDGGATAADVRELQDHTQAAADLTGDRIWSGAMRLPWVGDDLSAVRAAASAADAVADRAIPPLLQVAGTVDPAALRPVNGRIDLEPLTKAQAPLHAADKALTRALTHVAPYVGDGSHAGSLLGPVGHAVSELDTQLGDVAEQTSTASRAADLLPPMLGANGTRRYLLIFQNLSESRSLGGKAGAVAVVEADHGRITLTRQGGARDVPTFDKPVRTIDGAALYDPSPARYFQNVTQVLDYRLAGSLARQMWRQRTGEEVDGVVATDPVALSYLLKGAGPVTLADGTQLTAQNTVQRLLNDVYQQVDDPVAQDAFFETAAATVFRQLLGGDGDAATMVSALARASGEHRVLVWSAHEKEQARLNGTVLAGNLPAREKRNPTFGVFLNDGTGSKMSYYLERSISLTNVCRDDGRRGDRLDLTMTSTAPDHGLSVSVTGPGTYGAPKYTTRTVVYLVGPPGSGIVTVRVDGAARPVNTQFVDDRAVASVEIDLKPGQRAEVSADLVSPFLRGTARVRTTPWVRPVPVAVGRPQCPGLG
jgi:hypothetical protein